LLQHSALGLFLDRTCDRRNALENQFIETEADRGAEGERHGRNHSIRTSSVCGRSPEFAFFAVFSFEFSLGFAVFEPHKNEISKASFVTVIADETIDVSSISQLVVVFRSVLSNGQPVERFWGFTNPPGHDAESKAECIQASLEKVAAKPEKLISQSYDGTNVMSGQHAGVQAFIQCAYKNAQMLIATHISSILLLGKQPVRISKFEYFFPT
ncbi:hypothetical protein AVEN_228787-1, partial [Araneus ventricosus]